MKKILLVNPAVSVCSVPHTGLAMLSAVLKQQGHVVRIADYHFSSETAKIEKILDDFRPEVIGISLFSSMVSAADKLVTAIRAKQRNIPLLCGGPHTSSYYKELSQDCRFDYIIIGEAEDVIAGLAQNAVINKMPQIIHAPLPDINQLPFPDYASFYDYENMSIYPLITSRGCPCDCSFCSIGISNSRKWRPRPIEGCMEEMGRIKLKYPLVKNIVVWDDNFSLDIKRAKIFLETFIQQKVEYKLSLANLRADRIDREFLLLLKEAGCAEIQLGVEHGNPEVFQHVGKGETLEDIRRAARLANECRMKLGCSFIIGLPHDTLKRTRDSIRFAQELKADHIHWNILVPYKGTRVYDYFRQRGQVDDNSIPFTIPRDALSFEPNADTPYFTREERKKAYLMALLLSNDTLLLQDIKKAFCRALKYKLIKEFLLWLINPKIIKGLIGIAGKRILRCKE